MAFRIPDSVFMSSQFRASGMTPFDLSTVVKTTDIDGTDNPLAIFKFGPDAGKLWYCILDVEDLDGGAALVFDVILVDGDGNQVGADLVAGATEGQAGGLVEVRNFGVASGLPEEVANLYLAIDVTTPAGTPAQGTIRAVGLCTGNV